MSNQNSETRRECHYYTKSTARKLGGNLPPSLIFVILGVIFTKTLIFLYFTSDFYALNTSIISYVTTTSIISMKFKRIPSKLRTTRRSCFSTTFHFAKKKWKQANNTYYFVEN